LGKRIKIQQKKEEWIDFTKELLKHQPIKYALEIGCYDGGTTIFGKKFLKNTKKIKFFIVAKD
jgi:hypothetical protein